MRDAGHLPLKTVVQTVKNSPLGHIADTDFAKEVSLYADEVIVPMLEEQKIAGLTLSVVKDGEPILLRGYGYADAPAGIKVDPYRSMFRIGSIAKLFTWVAVMQLEEQGKLDLSANVNEYLTSFQLPEPHGKPLTMHDIMAHRPGYEDGGAGYMSYRDPAGVTSLRYAMETYIPAQVRAPGVAVAYSNYAVSLAGLIVEEISGQPFNNYVEEHIFEPLGMQYSSFREPLGNGHPEGPIANELIPHLAKGHWMPEDTHQIAGYEYIHATGPSGSASNSAADMARFMIAMLQNGEFEGKRILKAETVERMKERYYNEHPQGQSFAHGFMNGTHKGYEFFGHGVGSVRLSLNDEICT